MSRPSKKAKVDDNDNWYNTLIQRIEQIKWEPPAEPAISNEQIMAMIKPGPFLVGNADEERAFREANRAKVDAEREGESASIDGSDEGEHVGPEVGVNYIEMPNGEYVTISDYLGRHWVKHIESLYAVPPMPEPEHMAVKPHAYQLKGAAQAHWSCESLFKGILIGDGVGLGKTLLAILAMWRVKDEPGFSVVVAPKTLCQQWKSYIEGAFEDGYGMTAFVFDKTNKSATQLMAERWDVIIVSYDQLAALYKPIQDFGPALQAYRDDDTGKVKMPKRPTSALHSSFWDDVHHPIKRLVLDEAQCICKRDTARHEAVRNVPYKAIIQLSSTLAHGAWHSFSGYVGLLRSQPFTTHGLFTRTFGAEDYDGTHVRPDFERLRYLQRFLQAFTIARPSCVLHLKECHRFRRYFRLEPEVVEEIAKLVKKFEKAISSDEKERMETNVGIDRKRMRLLVRAQMISLHPLLADGPHAHDRFNNKTFTDGDENQDSAGGEKRQEFLDRVKSCEDLLDGAKRLQQLLLLYHSLRKTHPDSKIVIFSQYLKFLDIVAEALRRACGVEALRYDGTRLRTQARAVQSAFEAADTATPLLVTAAAGAGGFCCGVDMTAAGVVVIQTEIWWNLNTQEHALFRASGRQQGQQQQQEEEEPVLYIQLWAKNSLVDQYISKGQDEKKIVVSDVMEAIFRKPGRGPDIRDIRVLPRMKTTTENGTTV